MKRAILYFTLIVSVFLSCQKDMRQQTSPGSETTSQKNETEQIEEPKDLHQNEMDDEIGIDTITNQNLLGQSVDSTANSVMSNEVDDSDEENDSHVGFLTIISFLLGIVAVLSSIYVWRVAASETDRIEKKVDDKVKQLEKKLSQLEKGTKPTADQIVKKPTVNQEELLYALEKRINKLENNLQQSLTNRGEALPLSPVSTYPRRGYFGIPKRGDGVVIFNEYPKTLGDGAYFYVTYTDDTHCVFEPINLEIIRSIDAVSNAVEYLGTSLQYAKKMSVEQSGRAEKRGDFWEVKENAKIILEG